MPAAADQRRASLGRRLRLACAASVLAAFAGGCCGGRLVSVQLYGEAGAEPNCQDRGGLECTPARPGIPSGLGLHWRARTAAPDVQDFHGPAFGAPLPRFHPVPTRPVFEPRDEYTPLNVLEPVPTPADASDSPLSTQSSVLK